MMEVNFDGLEQPLCEYHNESMDALPELWDDSSVCFDPSDFAVELRGEDGCNSSIWSTLVPTDDDEDAIACRMTNSAQVVLHDRLITETTSFKKCTASAPPQTLPSLIFCPSTTHRRPDQQQQQHNVYSITIDSRGQVEIIQDTTAKSSSKNCIIIPNDPLSIGIKAEPASPAVSLSDDDDDEDDDDDYSEEDERQCNQSSRKRSLPPPSARNQPATKLIKSEGNINNRLAPFPAVATSNTVNFVLPPTPPSSASSDSEGGNVSPVRDVNSPKLDEGGNSEHQRRSATTSNRHPINSPLISYQPKGSTGVLQLTDEEKRTLLAEGYPIPTRLPLTKAEEKSLKKIRRKIKNKISAQESRRKKKEYMDTLERRAQELIDENADYRQRLAQLETDNAALQVQLKRLQKQLLTDKADNNLSHQHDLLED